MNIHISQPKDRVTKRFLDSFENLILILPAPQPKKWSVFPYCELLKRRLHKSGTTKLSSSPLVTDLPNINDTHVTLCHINADSNSFELLTVARKLASIHDRRQAKNVAVYLPGFTGEKAETLAHAICAAVLATNCELPVYKSGSKNRKKIRKLSILGLSQPIDFQRVRAEAEGNNLARQLTALPPNELTPASYNKKVKKLASEMGWRYEFLGQARLKKEGAGAFLAVAQGSENNDAGIIHLTYTPPSGQLNKKLSLVGKGVCFDTGGVNLKPAKHMHGMHEDMQGSAVALGSLLALSTLKAPFRIDCWLALAENHIGPRAYKQNEIVTASNGTTIEVMHTDAEGRMMLSDTLAIASKHKPDLIIDYATLTGTCVYALSSRYSGAFTNQENFHTDLIEAGKLSGERVWPFPMDEDFDKALDSDLADIKQCTLSGDADHILAARFLGKFAGKQPWVHIDLSAGNHKGGLAQIPTDITGFGVRLTTSLLLDRRVLDGNEK
ncbi:MAG: M17 family metallopeptidase [Gammaproteobacteria bacterium]